MRPRAIIVTGAGGVGKTTLAASLGVAAARRGLGTLVLTVDPARRLADALGLEDLGNEPSATPQPGLAAAMLDAEESWREVVERTAPAEAAQRLIESQFFDAIARRFPAGQSFAAAEQMTARLEERRWDLIVVDTPPSEGGIDFFLAPARIRSLVGGRVLRWLTGAGLPGRRRLYRIAAEPFLRMADAVLGSRLLEEVAEFLLDLRSAYDGLAKRANQIERRLRRARTVVVTTAVPVPMAEAARFFERLTEVGIRPAATIFNRALPAEWANADPKGELAPLVRSWGAESLHQANLRQEFSARHGTSVATIRWVAEPPTGLDALADLVEGADDLALDELLGA